ncbi:unnamed protein product, partial [Coccothraustes coccothraustes]
MSRDPRYYEPDPIKAPRAADSAAPTPAPAPPGAAGPLPGPAAAGPAGDTDPPTADAPPPPSRCSPESLKISWIPDTRTCLPTALPSCWAWGQPPAPGDRGCPAPVLLLSTETAAVPGRNVVPRRITAPATASSMVDWCSAGHRHGTNRAWPRQRTQRLQSASPCTARRVGRVFLAPASH